MTDFHTFQEEWAIVSKRCECNNTLTDIYTRSHTHACFPAFLQRPGGQLASWPANSYCWNHSHCTAALLYRCTVCICAGDAFMHFNCALTHAQLLHKSPSRASLSVCLHLPHLLSLPLSYTQETQKSTGTNKAKRQAHREDRKENL